jgi:hypothetical protein
MLDDPKRPDDEPEDDEDDIPQGGEHFGEAPLGEQDPADEDEALGGN